MHLFMIMYTAAGIGATWGPLPYGEAECQQRAKEFRLELVNKVMLAPSATGVAVAEALSYRFACEWRDQRPQLTKQ